MSTLLEYIDYQLKDTEMILNQLNTSLYNMTNGILCIVQKWLEIPLHLLTENTNLMGEVCLQVVCSTVQTFDNSAQKNPIRRLNCLSFTPS